MTIITIPLVQGLNCISFPASSVYNFRTIFTNSGIINDIDTFSRYDPILNNYVLINLDLGYIDQGKGYILSIISASPAPITYDGIEYTITFDQFKSRIVEGWNLLGIGKDAIVPQTWCKILDPITLAPVTILEPKRSYLVNYDECLQPVSHSIGSSSMTAIIAIGAILSTYYLLREFRIIGKPIETTYQKG